MPNGQSTVEYLLLCLAILLGCCLLVRYVTPVEDVGRAVLHALRPHRPAAPRRPALHHGGPRRRRAGPRPCYCPTTDGSSSAARGRLRVQVSRPLDPIVHSDEQPRSAVRRPLRDRLAVALRRRRHGRFEALVQELGDAVWEMDPTLEHVRFMSDRIHDLTGYTAAEILHDRDLWRERVIHPEDLPAVRVFSARLLEHGEAELEFRAVHKDGRERLLRSRGRRVLDRRGRVRGISGVTSDVTAERAARHELETAELRYRQLVEGLPVIPYRDATDGSEALYVSPRLEKVLGYTSEQWLEGGLGWWLRLVHPDDVVRVGRAMEESIERNEPLSMRYRVLDAEGEWRHVADELIVVRGAGGRPLYRQGMIRDVTAEEAALAAKGAAEQRFRTMVEQLPLAVYIDEPDGDFTGIYISPQIEPMLGYPTAQWVGNSAMFARVLHLEDRERVLAEQREWLARGGSYQGEYRLRHRNGDDVWVREVAIVVADAEGAPQYVQGYLEDITERRAAERELIESEQRLRTVTDNLNDVIFLYGMDRKLRYVTPSFETLTGATLEEIYERNFLNDVHPDDERRMTTLWRSLWDGESYTGAEFRIIHRDGHENWCWSAGSPVYDESGTQIGVQIRDADISARKRAELRLRASEARARSIVETTDDAFLALDGQGLAMEWNRAAEEMFGIDRELVVGGDVIAQIVAESSREVLTEVLRAVADEGAESEHRLAELTVRRQSGEEFPVEVAVWPIASNEELTFNMFIRDITERKLREERVTFLAYHDQLTGLPNRTMFEQHLDLVLARAAHDGSAAALLYLDVDKFKHVNDTYGHDAGDELLKDVARRLRAAARASDLVVRLGGDEFVIVLGDVPSDVAETVAEGVARRVCEQMARPFDVGNAFQTSASIGIALYPANALDAKGLVNAADWGMYASKRAGRGGYTFAQGDARAA